MWYVYNPLDIERGESGRLKCVVVNTFYEVTSRALTVLIVCTEGTCRHQKFH